MKLPRKRGVNLGLENESNDVRDPLEGKEIQGPFESRKDTVVDAKCIK